MQSSENSFDRPSAASPVPPSQEERGEPTAIGEGSSADVRRAFEDVTGSVEELYRIGDRYLERQARQRPYAVLGAAAGIGFVLGGGLASRLTSGLISYAGRLAMMSGLRALVQHAEQENASAYPR